MKFEIDLGGEDFRQMLLNDLKDQFDTALSFHDKRICKALKRVIRYNTTPEEFDAWYDNYK